MAFALITQAPPLVLADTDSDGDGAPDGQEISEGYDPNNPNSYPPRFVMVKNRADYHFSWMEDFIDLNSLTFHDLWGAGINSSSSGFDSPWDFTQLGGYLEYYVPLPTALPAPPRQYSLAPLPFSVGGSSNIYGFQSSAYLEHAAVWLQVSPAPTQPITRTVLKVTEMNAAGILSGSTIVSGPYATKSVEALTFTIPAATVSPPVPLQPVTSTVRKLLPSFFYNPSTGWNQFNETETVSLVQVEFNIFSGQDAATMVPEDKEETVGAFTVANLNDTDGDGIIDNVDDSVKAAVGAAGVSDEVDLMKLEIRGPTTGRMKVTVVGGAVKFWEKKTKETPVALNNGVCFINASDLPKTLWVEATAVSAAVRDMNLKLGYEPPNGGALVDDLDRVKATAVWVTKSNFIHQIAQQIPNDFDADISNFWRPNPTAMPPQPALLVPGAFFQSAGPRHGMIMEFTIAPAGIESETAVKFDLARKVESKTLIWAQANQGYAASLLSSTSVTPFDQANDDNATTDEDADPTNLHIYDQDVAGVNFPAGSLQEWPSEMVQDMANFYDWARVRFDGQRPDNANIGSRCSPQEKWSFQSKSGFTIQNNKRVWFLAPNFLSEVKDTHVQIPANP